MCNGEMLNKHSEGYHGFNNPLEILPPVGSIIDYMTIDEKYYKTGEGVVTSYKVLSIRFYTRETSNNGYKHQRCTIEVEKLSI